MTRPIGFEVTYGYLADLCAAMGWSLELVHLDGEDVGRSAIRVRESRGGELLGGAKFTSDADLDAVADVVFDVLRQGDHV